MSLTLFSLNIKAIKVMYFLVLSFRNYTLIKCKISMKNIRCKNFVKIIGGMAMSKFFIVICVSICFMTSSDKTIVVILFYKFWISSKKKLYFRKL